MGDRILKNGKFQTLQCFKNLGLYNFRKTYGDQMLFKA